MRVQIIQTSHLPTASQQLADAIRGFLSHAKDICVADDFPDIIHVIGADTYQVARRVEQAATLRIPVLLSPVGTLYLWHRRGLFTKLRGKGWDLQRNMVRQATAVHAYSAMEATTIERLGWNPQVQLIANPVTSNLITVDDMGKQLLALYRSTVQRHDEAIRETIRQSVEQAARSLEALPLPQELSRACHLFLYAKYQYGRHNLPVGTLQELSGHLLHADMDEDLLGTLLHQLKLYPFAARLEQVMADMELITEGFMPVPALDDRQTAQLAQAVNRLPEHQEHPQED